MRHRAGNAVSPQRKIISNADKFGNAGIKKQQGTTRVLYDSLLLDGTTNLRFFEGSNNRDFPLTNTGADGNRLGVGGAMAIERCYYSIVTITAGVVTSITTLDAVLDDLLIGEQEISIANNVVLKNMALLSMDPRFNKNATFDGYNNFEYDTQLVLNPLLEFVFPTRVNTYTPIVDTYLRLTIEGTGAIISPRGTF